MTGLLQDARYALRQSRKSPGFAAAAILVLALGLGAVTGMLAVVQSVLIRPLNYRDSSRLMLLGVSDQASGTSDISYPDFLEMKGSLKGQRVREIGIRLALGATRSNVFGLVARQGLWMVGVGLVLGWIGSLRAARWIHTFLFGTTAHDPLTYTLAGALVLLASVIAILLPARRAASIEPMEALRTE
jgi:hypothetical protein